MGAIIGSDSLERQQERICKIIHTLGPAVLPSECALRPVTPVTKGPVRGHRLHISPPLLTTPLEALTKLYSNLMDKRMDAVIAALESGRWRLGSDSSIDYDEVLGLASSEDVTVNRRPRDTTFLDTMKINYSDSTSNIDGSETSLKSRIWTQHILDLPMPEPARYLRHEPDDPTTIYRLKSPRLSEMSSFVSNVTALFGPHLRAPKNLRQDERLDNRIKYATGRFIDAVSTKPEFPLKFYDISHVRKEEDYSMRLGIVPFTKFLDHDAIGTSEYQNVSLIFLEHFSSIIVSMRPQNHLLTMS